MSKKRKKITIRLSVIGVLLMAVLIYFFAFNLKPVEVIASSDLIEFSKDGFVDSMGLNNTNKLVASKGSFELYLDETTSYFKVIDTRNGEVWESNPSVEDPWVLEPGRSLTPAASNNQKSTIQLQYITKAGTRIDINNYRNSIYHPESIIAPEGARTYSIKYLADGFQVLYEITSLEIDHLWFPKFLTDEDLLDRTKFSALDAARLRQFYGGYDSARNLHFIQDDSYGSKMTTVAKRTLFGIFYNADGSPKENLGITRDVVIELNEEYGYYDATDALRLEVGVQVKLTKDGFETSIIKESLAESSSYRIASITLYPLLGTAIAVNPDNTPTKGALVIPDGSGAIIDFNNNKENHSPYRKRLYGHDLALLPLKEPEEQQQIHLPLYGMIKENSGFAAIITQGDAQTSIGADTSNRVDSYNKIYPTFHLRENELITLGTGWVTHSLNLWTQKVVNSDLTISYKLLIGDDNSYVGIANAYKDYLIEEDGLTKVNKEFSNLMIEFLGAYDEKAYFLGFSYRKTKTMTTFKEALKITNEYQDLGINLDAIYRGALEDGLRNDIQTNAKIEKELGGNKGYKKLENELDKLNSNLYLQTNIARARSFNKIFDQYRYAATRLNGSHAYFYKYHSPTGLPYSESSYDHSEDDYIINPAYYQTIYNKFKKNLVTDNIAHLDIGRILTGHYKKGSQLYRQDALNISKELLKNIKENQLIYSPLGFSFAHIEYAADLPTSTTQYPIIDDQIPLIQLILAGYVPYSSKSFNLNTTRSEEYNFLKLIETGSNLKYTLSFDDPRKLINTEYNEFMSTYYGYWTDIIQRQTEELNNIKLYEGYLVDHERVSRDVYKVTYSNGLEIYINYNLSSVSVDGITINSLDYVVTKEA